MRSTFAIRIAHVLAARDTVLRSRNQKNGYTAYHITSRPGTQEVPQALAGPEAKEATFKTKEKDDMKYRKGLFRMGMKLQGLLNQLSRTDDKKQATEIKAQIKAIR